MSNKYEVPLYLVSAQFDLDTTGDKATFTAPPFRTVLYGVGITVDSTDAGGGVVKFDRRPTAGSDTSRGDGDAGVVTIPASNQQGKVLIDTAFRGLAINPGDQIVAEVTSDPGAGPTMYAQVWLQYDPEEVGNLSDVTET